MAEVKPEIKVDPAGGSPRDAEMADVEQFEDDVDLHVPPPPPEGPQAWLVKLPKYVWEAWNDIYRNIPDGQPLEIGKMRVYNSSGNDGGDGSGNGNGKAAAADGDQDPSKKIQIRLNSGVLQHLDLPKNYNLNINSNGYSNTVVFSEKDLPGAKSHPFGRRSRFAGPKPSGIFPKSERYGPVKPGTYRTAIPKQTALAPLIHHVADAAPVQDDSYYAHFDKMYKASLQPARTTTFSTGIDRAMHPGTTSKLDNFTLSSRPNVARGKKKQAPREKAVRISQQALVDQLYHAFREYRYWSLKALRNRLHQPEAYIKQTLDGIATLVRSGDFAMTYVLKPEFLELADIKPEDVKEELATVKSEDERAESDSASADEMMGDDDDDDDDDPGDFEDVKMEGPAS